jgi:hypothetical protein
MVVDMWLTAPTGRFYARWFGFGECAIVFALVQHILFCSAYTQETVFETKGSKN